MYRFCMKFLISIYKKQLRPLTRQNVPIVSFRRHSSTPPNHNSTIYPSKQTNPHHHHHYHHHHPHKQCPPPPPPPAKNTNANTAPPPPPTPQRSVPPLLHKQTKKNLPPLTPTPHPQRTKPSPPLTLAGCFLPLPDVPLPSALRSAVHLRQRTAAADLYVSASALLLSRARRRPRTTDGQALFVVLRVLLARVLARRAETEWMQQDGAQQKKDVMRALIMAVLKSVVVVGGASRLWAVAEWYQRLQRELKSERSRADEVAESRRVSWLAPPQTDR